jgi:glutaminyl-tRNA synthetase
MDIESVLKKLGVIDRKVKQVTKQKKTAEALTAVLIKAGVVNANGEVVETIPLEKTDLLIDVAGKVANETHRDLLVQYVMENKIGAAHLDKAIKYLKGADQTAPVDISSFEAASGVGVVVTDAEIESVLKQIIEEHKITDFKTGLALVWQEVNKKIPFAEKTKVNFVLNTNFISAKPKEQHVRDFLLPEDVGTAPEKNTQATPELLAAHLKETGGQIITRFPPEPNGYLHIGHAKSMNLNFGLAKKFNGICYMRFDDSNPETEKVEYIDSILNDMQWMGHKWDRLTYASDYFLRLYQCAIQLIKLGKAFVCHQTGEEIEISRKNHTDSPFRNRTVEENLTLFEEMKAGKWKEGTAILRMKMDMKSGNSCMWDLIAYRIKFVPHHRTKDQWCIYPSYDFTHCLCDTFENITHSLCTLEFNMRRESYNWLVNTLGLYLAKVHEFARLQLTNTILSKRKLIQLVEGKHVTGWDDPRMSTVRGFRRRGFSPEGINKFCDDVGITTRVSIIPIEKLEQFVRLDLDKTSRRIFAIFDPIRVTLKNFDGEVKSIKCPNVPNLPVFGDHFIPFTGNFFIERNDFREKDEKDYFGMALDNSEKVVRLKYTDFNIKLIEIKKNDDGSISELIVEHSTLASKHAIHWVPITAGEEPIKIEVREYDRLFLSEDPIATYAKEWLKDLNPNSLKIVTAIIDPSVKELKAFDRIQLERAGFYMVDPDTTSEKVVLNKTMGLKESKWKATNK